MIYLDSYILIIIIILIMMIEYWSSMNDIIGIVIVFH